jgi:N-acetylmuramoyl-L-alanine amidase
MSLKTIVAAVMAAALLFPSITTSASPSPVTKLDREQACLVAAAWNEARGRPDIEIAAVMHVVINRTEHPAFNKTVCGVVLQKGQFQMSKPFREAVVSASATGKFVMKGLRDADRAILDKLAATASMILDGNSVDVTKGATHFWSPKLRSQMGYASGPSWAMKLPQTLALGPFRFHRLKA